MERREIKVRNYDGEEEDDISSPTARELKDAHLTYYLPRSSNRHDLIARVVASFESLTNNEADGCQHLDEIVED